MEGWPVQQEPPPTTMGEPREEEGTADTSKLGGTA